MRFETWLKKQKDRDDATGDLANDYILSLYIWKSEGHKKFLSIVDSLDRNFAPSSASEAFENAYAEFSLTHPENVSVKSKAYQLYNTLTMDLSEEE